MLRYCQYRFAAVDDKTVELLDYLDYEYYKDAGVAGFRLQLTLGRKLSQSRRLEACTT